MNKLFFSENKSKIRILNFLRKADSFFTPKISYRVDLNDYAQKIIDFGEVFWIENGNLDIGMIAFYINNKTKKSFITSISVVPEYQRLGIGKKLLRKAEQVSKKRKMRLIELEVSKQNCQAISFYKKFGFSAEAQAAIELEDSFILFKNLYEL